MKFISSNYNSDTGIASVIVQHLGKRFTGRAVGHPEDKENWSEYAGCSYAETRATIKALKYERALAKEKAEISRNFVKACENYAGFNKDDASAKAMYRQLNRRIKRVNDLADQINSLYMELDISIKRRKIVVDALQKKKAERQNSIIE